MIFLKLFFRDRKKRKKERKKLIPLSKNNQNSSTKEKEKEIKSKMKNLKNKEAIKIINRNNRNKKSTIFLSEKVIKYLLNMRTNPDGGTAISSKKVMKKDSSLPIMSKLELDLPHLLLNLLCLHRRNRNLKIDDK